MVNCWEENGGEPRSPVSKSQAFYESVHLLSHQGSHQHLLEKTTKSILSDAISQFAHEGKLNLHGAFLKSSTSMTHKLVPFTNCKLLQPPLLKDLRIQNGGVCYINWRISCTRFVQSVIMALIMAAETVLSFSVLFKRQENASVRISTHTIIQRVHWAVVAFTLITDHFNHWVMCLGERASINMSDGAAWVRAREDVQTGSWVRFVHVFMLVDR